MFKLRNLLMGGLIALLGMSACTSKAQSSSDSASAPTPSPAEAQKMIVCYFSATGTTAKAAQRIADIAGADIYEITPQQPYTEADLDWRDSLSRSSVEMHNLTSRPAIVDSLPDMKNYDVVFIGYPNWWNTHPTIINTFIEANDLTGKTIVPFMTSGGGDILHSEEQLKESYPTLKFSKGLLLNEVSDKQIRDWVNGVGK